MELKNGTCMEFKLYGNRDFSHAELEELAKEGNEFIGRIVTVSCCSIALEMQLPNNKIVVINVPFKQISCFREIPMSLLEEQWKHDAALRCERIEARRQQYNEKCKQEEALVIPLRENIVAQYETFKTKNLLHSKRWYHHWGIPYRYLIFQPICPLCGQKLQYFKYERTEGNFVNLRCPNYDYDRYNWELITHCDNANIEVKITDAAFIAALS